MSNKILKSDVDALIRRAVEEDIGTGDVTSNAIFDATNRSRAGIIAKSAGVFCGGDIIGYVYANIDPSITVKVEISDGADIDVSDVAAEIEGPTIGVLSGERITLNFLQRMCGIATATKDLVSMVRGTGIKILDTRKTLPGYRKLDKYAVKCGSGENHRQGLYDMVLIKDNHIKAAGGIAEAIRMVRKRYGRDYMIEAEASNLEEVNDAVREGADIIMLDNMDDDMIRQSIAAINRKVKIEVSGNVDEMRIAGLKGYAIDYISVGALTHSVRAFDLSMKFY